MPTVLLHPITHFNLGIQNFWIDLNMKFVRPRAIISSLHDKILTISKRQLKILPPLSVWPSLSYTCKVVISKWFKSWPPTFSQPRTNLFVFFLISFPRYIKFWAFNPIVKQKFTSFSIVGEWWLTNNSWFLILFIYKILVFAQKESSEVDCRKIDIIVEFIGVSDVKVETSLAL